MYSAAQRFLFPGILICLFVSTTAMITAVLQDQHPKPVITYPNGDISGEQYWDGTSFTENTAIAGAVKSQLDNNSQILEGDIMLTKQQQEHRNRTLQLIAPVVEEKTGRRHKRQAYHGNNYPHYFWQNGVVPYSFQSGLSKHAISIINKSMDFWERNTCINFTRTSYEKSMLVFMRGKGCYSYIGRVWYWEKQPLSVGSRCEHIHTISHEIGHALGFLHTHNRVDRDNYISVNFKNVQDGLISNFNRVSRNANYNYGLPYDYGSVMHYSKKAFTANSDSTIIPRVSWYEDTMGSGTGPTFIDLLMMNKHYNCLNKCSSNVKCQNGGYPHPRNCKQCLCPSGYGGKYCQRKANSPDCGGNLRASPEWQTLSAQMGDGVFKDDMSYCYWWIQSKPEQVIEAKITSLSGDCSEGCIFGGLELKVHPDKRLTGYRFCCKPSVGKTIEVQGPILPVILFNRKGYTEMQIQFRVKSNETYHKKSSSSKPPVYKPRRSSKAAYRRD